MLTDHALKYGSRTPVRSHTKDIFTRHKIKVVESRTQPSRSPSPLMNTGKCLKAFNTAFNFRTHQPSVNIKPNYESESPNLYYVSHGDMAHTGSNSVNPSRYTTLIRVLIIMIGKQSVVYHIWIFIRIN